ncbi:uncharacterized protein LOC125234268 [Leguminivora glycinivorella]|uniref:uncharacterized protein LOC125234268 n=1 Tax=Leguminivora glycinivorella TaxID=1035111 RepID=UPI00200CF675|nr:uncharacterized protein LOC125234268 [Leguminivora glycinivorella]
MWIGYRWVVYLFLFNLDQGYSDRQRRYLLFTTSTQYGIFATVSVPLHPDTTTSVAWFYEANYYNVANASYFEPLLGDVAWGRSEDKRSADNTNELLTRRLLYTSIEAMLEKNRFPGRSCLLRAICEAATSQLTHNGVLGDLLHLALTPSTSMEEADVEECFYEAELRGALRACARYRRRCPDNPLDYISLQTEQFIH